MIYKAVRINGSVVNPTCSEDSRLDKGGKKWYKSGHKHIS